MLSRHLAVSTAPLKLKVREAIDTVARLGARGIQFDAREELPAKEFGHTAKQELLHLLSERNLRVASLSFPLRRPLASPEHVDARIEAIRNAMTFTRELKANVLTLPLGGLPDDAKSAERNLLAELLRDLARHGNHVGVTLCLTLRGEQPVAVQQLLEQVTEGPIGIDLDPAGCVLAQAAPASVARDLHAFLQHVQIRDAVRLSAGFGREVPLGRGEVDWDEFAAVLHEVEYRGWLTVIRSEGDDRLGDVSRALTFLKNLLPQ